jgi:mono/diheme cytochrome c family protein
MIAAWSPRGVAVLVLSLAVFACARRPSEAPAMTPTHTPTPPDLPVYEVRLGREVYQHYCQICHGDTGAGDGFNAFNLDPRPRDLSDPDFQKKKTDADLRDAILRGGAGVGLSPLMPPWGRTLSPRQMDDVILYMRTLRHSGS